ncbi:dipeptide ABC transporter ATP-binding protein [Planctomonas psychrotolerans]|uniref:dipeptide ABC transporter ATP-binding protein n=1 Tax=Planctomonas psychrotolerans TaxID=2528712 RepID=UPI00123B3DC3|nr:ABC transporter ATP-binding protein [Planctomonas psychrotolerans]
MPAEPIVPSGVALGTDAAAPDAPAVPVPVLEIRDLSVSYRTGHVDTEVVHGISLRVDPGEVVAVVGESGSGKTTTAHAAIGLLPSNGHVSGGQILLNGADISGWSDKQLEAVRGVRIGLVPQDPSSSLNPVKTIGAQIGEVLQIHRRGNRSYTRAFIRTRVLELLARVGIPEPERRSAQYPHQLSGGMRQRVLIAIAIALEPQLIIADEPTSALDVTVQKRVLDLLDDLRAEFGTAILFVTHDLGVAAERSSRMVVMRSGRVEEEGGTADILATPRSDYTRRLLADAPGLTVTEFRRPADPSAVVPDEIVARNLVREYPAGKGGKTVFRAVDDVSFTVPRGTTHAIVGESGSGKTTTVRMTLGLVQPSSGSVEVAGLDPQTLRGEALRQFRRRIQLVYQNPFGSLDPRQTVEAIVQEPLRNFRLVDPSARATRAAGLIDRVALPASVLSRRPRELSGGQRQRVAIARALAADPEVLVLDEAVSALDVTVQAQILGLLDELQRELGLTYLFVSHDLAVVRAISDTVSVMSLGRVVESGPTRTLFQSPQHEYTRELLAAVPSAHAGA